MMTNVVAMIIFLGSYPASVVRSHLAKEKYL